MSRITKFNRNAHCVKHKIEKYQSVNDESAGLTVSSGSTLQQYIKNLAERAVAYLNVDIAVTGTHVQLLANLHLI